MDTVIRFVNILAWIGAVGFGLRFVLGFTFAAIYYLTRNKVRLQDEVRGVTRDFHPLRYLLLASICAAWIYAAGAY